MPAFVLRLTRRLTDALAILGALGVVAMLVHINIDVVLRQLFHWPVPATNEIVSRYYPNQMQYFFLDVDQVKIRFVVFVKMPTRAFF